MNIEEFKKLEKMDAVLYDFKNNIVECNTGDLRKHKEKVEKLIKDIKNSNTAIDKFMNFKQYGVKSKVGYDCDSSKLTMEIFEKCFEFLNGGEIKYQAKVNKEADRRVFTYEVELKNNEYVGDAMNSMQTIANCSSKKKNKESIEFIKESEEFKEKFEEFALLTHTIGNFMPVPKGTFNGFRYQPTSDFWDLTLECIRSYYLTPTVHTPLCSVLNCNEKNVEWLNQFGYNLEGWKNFIDKNFLKMYVEGDDYKVIPLFTGHSFENKLPEGDKIIEFLNDICKKIRKRGEEICSELSGK